MFAQDREACEAIERMLQLVGDDAPEVQLRVDGGPLRARRRVEQMVSTEQTRRIDVTDR